MPQSSASRSRTRLIGFVIVIVSLLVLFRTLPVADLLTEFLTFVRNLGYWGPILVVLTYIVATVVMLPGTILTLGAGFAFGLGVGFLVVSIGSTVGALLAFLLGRSVAREFVAKTAAENPKFSAIDRAVEKSGFRIVLLTRLSPIFPFNVLNYLFSLTAVSTKDYFIASWLGMLPGTLMYVYFGSALKSLADIASGNFSGGLAQQILFAVGLLATIAVSIYVGKIAKRAIDSEGQA